MTDIPHFPTPRAHDDPPVLDGRRVKLRPVTPDDYRFLYEISTSTDNLVRWRYRGSTPAPEAFAQSLWQGVQAQFVIVRAGTSEPLGLIISYNADLRNQTVFMAIIIAPGLEGQGWVLDATALFLVYLFRTWPIRKVYYEMLEFNFARISSGAGRHFTVEGCLIDHEYHDGRLWNFYTLAVYRQQYLDMIEPLWARIASGAVTKDRSQLLGFPEA